MLSASKKGRKNKEAKRDTQSFEKVLNYDTNKRYLALKRMKFWHLVEETRRNFDQTTPSEAMVKGFNTEYVQMHNVPPLSAFRIKANSAYSYHKNYERKEGKGLVPIRGIPVDPSKRVNVIGDKEFEELEQIVNPAKLLCIRDEDQEKFNFTIEEKQGRPMYEMDDTNEYPSSSDEDTKDQQKKKTKIKLTYTPRRIVAPLEYPFAYYRLKKNETCFYCYGVGKDCHNIRFGPYLAALVARFYREHSDWYNEHDAARFFLESYRVLTEFEDNYLEENKIKAESNDVKMPECIVFDRLVFALNSVEWTVMWGLNERRMDSPPPPLKKLKAKNDKTTTTNDSDVNEK